MKTILAFNILLLCALLPEIGNAQLIIFTGNILNENTGNALENVNIFESNSGIGTITNLSGFFSLMLKPGNVEIVISHDGFQKFTRKLVFKLRNCRLIASILSAAVMAEICGWQIVIWQKKWLNAG